MDKNYKNIDLSDVYLHPEILERLVKLGLVVYSVPHSKHSLNICHCFKFHDCGSEIQSLKEVASGCDIFIDKLDSYEIQVSWISDDIESYRTGEASNIFKQILDLIPKEMSWAKLLSPLKSKTKGSYPKRTLGIFEHDSLRIISSHAFRKLQNKTQVIPMCNNDLVHNRLTHSIEVATVGKKLARMFADYAWETYITIDEVEQIRVLLNCGVERGSIKEIFINSVSDIVYAACLIHDIGNPPYGHQGEKALKETYEELIATKEYKDTLGELAHEYPDIFKIESNAQTIRLLANNKDIDLTYATLAASIKYPRLYNLNESIYKKFNIYESEQKLFKSIISQCDLKYISNNEIARHPLVYLVEAADDICYSLFDFEDFVNLGLISQDVYCNTLINIILPNLDAPLAKKTNGNTIEDKRCNYKKLIQRLDVDDAFSKLRSDSLFQLMQNALYAINNKYENIMSGNYTIENKLLNKTGKINGLLDIYSSIMENSIKQDGFARSNSTLKEHSIIFGYNNLAVLKNSLGGYEVMSELLKSHIIALHSLDSLKSQMILLTMPDKYLHEDLREALVKRNAKSWVEVLSRKDKPAQVRLLNDYLTGLTDTEALKLFKHLKGHELVAKPYAR